MVIEAQKDSPLPNKDATYEDIYDFKKIEGYFKLLTKISILSMVLLGLKILLEFLSPILLGITVAFLVFFK